MKPTSAPANNPLSFEVIHQTLQEVGDFFAWIIRDPLRPGVGLTIVPVVCLFLSAFLQGAAFALVVGFISLSTTDWKITGADIQSNLPEVLTNILSVSNDTLIDLTPTPAVIASIITVFASVYLVHAALATFGNSRLIDLGYLYHSRCAQRLIIDNRLKLDRGARRVGVEKQLDSRMIISMANSESRYLGRALTTIYSTFNSILTLGIGLGMIIHTDPLVFLGGLVFLVLALVLQTVVVAFAMRASRDLVDLSGPNTAGLASLVQSITVSPAIFSVTPDSISQEMVGSGPIYDYDMAYQRRLKIGLYSQLLTNIAFACALVILLAYLIGGVRDGTLVPVAAFASIVIYRFIFGGAAGLLGGFISFVALKPYFDNYLRTVATRPTEGRAGSVQNGSKVEFSMVDSHGARIPLLDGDTIAVALNDAPFSWVTLLNILDSTLTDSSWANLNLKRDVVLVNNGYPLLNEDAFYSSGLPESIEWERVQAAFPAFSKDFEAIEEIVAPSNDGVSGQQKWQELTPRLATLMGFANAISRDARLIFVYEGALRSLSERERIVLSECISDRNLIVFYPLLPSFTLKPFPTRFLLLSEHEVIAEIDPTDPSNIPDAIVEEFYRTGAQDGGFSIIEEF